MKKREEINVMISGGFRQVFLDILSEKKILEKYEVKLIRGESLGNAINSIPNRLRRAEACDVVIMARQGLELVQKEGLVFDRPNFDLAQSGIGMAVQSGRKIPPINNKEDFCKLLFSVKSIGISKSASGQHLKDLFSKLNLKSQLEKKIIEVGGEPIAAAILRGDIEMGMQQLSEIIPYNNIEVLGLIPHELQKYTVFSIGIPKATEKIEIAKNLLEQLRVLKLEHLILKNGMQPIGWKG